jgi:hypothetical protein
MHIIHTIGGDARRQNDNSIRQRKKHEFSARSRAIDERREEDADIDQQGDPETGSRPTLPRKFQSKPVNEEETHSRTGNTIRSIEWYSDRVLQGEAHNEQRNESWNPEARFSTPPGLRSSLVMFFRAGIHGESVSMLMAAFHPLQTLRPSHP